ncbi:MAG: tRNA(Ile)(2)-agmatinylcytidine synthase [Methanomassiliicoccales archaeon]|jgi:tRNA(Ile2)-agmatinylcytidine synthase|nr:tRNA(Ile)(2)-agmatinylcytidine synthase [Methanomassiliicoccales archaeon]
MIVAFDDTDSTEGMCTTFLATKIIEELESYDLIGFPRLVRLNPAVPWKTRGNGAIAMRFGHGRGKKTQIGMISGSPVYSYERGESDVKLEEVAQRCGEVLKRWARTEEGASPGLVVTRTKPRESFYWNAVRSIVERGLVEEELKRIGAIKFELSGGRGIIGATAAAAWRPKDRTYEIITYRFENKWGTEREIDESTVKSLDSTFPSTFNNYDLGQERIAIAPHSPCPILFGIRGDDVNELVPAMQSIKGEPAERWLIYLTNQGTDDHIITDWRELTPCRSYAVKGVVLGGPTTIKGGHVVFKMLPDQYRMPIDCTAYEPSKSFRDVIRALNPGDRIVVYGELRDEPRTLNIEKLRVLDLVESREKTGNPVCPSCGKRMKSIGRSAGYRCRRCGSKASEADADYRIVPRPIQIGWYEPPVCSRRHLSKPLKRVLQKPLRFCRSPTETQAILK